MIAGPRAFSIIACAIAVLALAPVAVAKVHAVETVATGDSSAPFAFNPPSLTIEIGDTVRWVNGDGTYHTTTSRGAGGSANGDLWQGVLGSKDATYEHTFNEAGTFAYFCSPHASFMAGTITVNDAADPGEAENTPGFGFLAPLAALGLVALRRLN